MARYQVWNKTDEIYTPSGAHFTAEEWKARYSWINIPGAKMIITAGNINGGAAMEWEATINHYKSQGAVITDDMTDAEVLAAIEDFEDNPPIDDTPTSEERIAAALEAQVLMSTPEVESVSMFSMNSASTMSLEDSEPTSSAAFERIKNNYQRGLWDATLVGMAMQKGQITEDEMTEILS